MISTLFEQIGSAAFRGLSSAAGALSQLTPPGDSFEAILRGSDADAVAAPLDAASRTSLLASLDDQIDRLGDRLHQELRGRLAAGGVNVQGPLALDRNALGQWTVADPHTPDRVAAEQALSDLPEDFESRLAEYRRALAMRESLQAGGSAASPLAGLIDEQDAVRVTVSRDDISVD